MHSLGGRRMAWWDILSGQPPLPSKVDASRHLTTLWVAPKTMLIACYLASQRDTFMGGYTCCQLGTSSKMKYTLFSLHTNWFEAIVMQKRPRGGGGCSRNLWFAQCPWPQYFIFMVESLWLGKVSEYLQVCCFYGSFAKVCLDTLLSKVMRSRKWILEKLWLKVSAHGSQKGCIKIPCSLICNNII